MLQQIQHLNFRICTLFIKQKKKKIECFHWRNFNLLFSAFLIKKMLHWPLYNCHNNQHCGDINLCTGLNFILEEIYLAEDKYDKIKFHLYTVFWKFACILVKSFYKLQELRVAKKILISFVLIVIIIWYYYSIITISKIIF